MAGGIDSRAFQLALQLAGDAVELDDPLDFISKEDDPVAHPVLYAGMTSRLSPRTERARAQLQVVALVMASINLRSKAVAPVDMPLFRLITTRP